MFCSSSSWSWVLRSEIEKPMYGCAEDHHLAFLCRHCEGVTGAEGITALAVPDDISTSRSILGT